MSEEVPAIGIDLGTTNSCVAVYFNGRAEIIVNDRGKRTTPSYVGFSDQETLIGETAKSRAYRNYRNTIFDVKRLIGRKYEDETVQNDIKNWPFEVVNKNGNPEFKVKFRNQELFYCPEQVSAIILDRLKEFASKRVEAPVKKAVITVPAYFNDSQRQATKDAGKLAGLDVVRLLNEPTAAAIAYALDKNSHVEKNALIFDLGGGTFDVSIVRFENRHVTVRAIDGDTHLGGDDFDNRLLNYFIQEMLERDGYDIRGNRSAVTRLLAACEKAKQDLSFQTLANLDLPSLYNGEDFESTISRAKFDDINDDLFKKTLDIVKSCVDEAGLLSQDIDTIVLVGGSTRIPRIQNLLQDFFGGKRLSSAVNPDEAVALGAAIHAASLSQHESQAVEDFVLKDVLPLSLGVETAGGLMSVFIKRNTPLPAVATKSFTTARANQPSVNIKIFEGERPLTKENNLLGELRVTGILPAPVGTPRIDETFCVDESGILSVTAIERSSGKTLSLDINLVKGRLSKEEIRRIIEDASSTREHDKMHRNTIDARNELEAYCNLSLRLAKSSKMTFPHRIFVTKRCKEVLSEMAGNAEDELSLSKKLRNLKLECEPILKMYKQNDEI